MSVAEEAAEADILSAALGYAAMGWKLLPVHPNSKRPIGKDWQERASSDPEVIVSWFAGAPAGTGVCVHLGASGLVAIDVDYPEEAPEELKKALTASKGWRHRGNSERLTMLFTDREQRTPQATGHGWGEVKAANGVIILAPSVHPHAANDDPACKHPEGHPYEWVSRGGKCPPLLPAAVQAMVAPTHASGSDEEGSGTPWEGEEVSQDHVDACVDRRAAMCAHLAGMGKAEGHGRNRTAYNYANALGHYVPHVLDREETASLLMAACKTNGLVAEDGLRSVSETIRSGMRKSAHEPQLPAVLRAWDPGVEEGEAETADPWQYGGDLSMAEDEPDMPPTLLTRTDGLCLLYPGGVHNVVGESESGKSWLAIAAIAENAGAGGVSIYVDYEDHRSTFLSRLRLLGVSQEQLKLIHYYAAEAHWSGAPGELLERHAPSLVVLDAVSEAMSAGGLDPIGTVDATHFVRWARRWTATGAALILIDHVVKDKNSQGRWSVGSQHKVSGVQAHYVIEPMGVLVPGERAQVIVKVGKNRAGHVRAGSTVVSGGDRLQVVGMFSFGGPVGQLCGWEIAPMAPEVADFGMRQSERAEREVLDYLRKHPGVSANVIEHGIAGVDGAPPRAALRSALQRLVDRNQVRMDALGGRKGNIYTLIDLFAEESEHGWRTTANNGEQTAN